MTISHCHQSFEY